MNSAYPAWASKNWPFSPSNASQFNTSHTVMRNPRTHGWPERLPGSTVMRELTRITEFGADPELALLVLDRD